MSVQTTSTQIAPGALDANRERLADAYHRTREFTVSLCSSLSLEDMVVQSTPEASPAKWHLAHTTWFFETFLLIPYSPGYQPFHPQFGYLFNSYYNAVGERHPRPQRGLLTRPGLVEIFRYRKYVNDNMAALLEAADAETLEKTLPLLEVGINHEQQHQELLLADIKHLLSCNPLLPAYTEQTLGPASRPTELNWRGFDEGLRLVGYAGDGFAFDNEKPEHRRFVQAFELADRLITNGEYLEFIEDGGYTRPELWLDEGWAVVQEQGWQAPIYWRIEDKRPTEFSLYGSNPLDPNLPACHLSFYEADAFARWKGARLPTEAEWETACRQLPPQGNLARQQRLHPAAAVDSQAPAIRQAFGDVWEWTADQYRPYSGYRPPAGALGEYNGKFMCNQFVLRGGSCFTPAEHIRATYRNFFHPGARWQCTGIRLARDAS